MRTIKRYTNRKLYDSQERRYITLEELATLIRQGEEIEVRDHISGADLTTLVMMQTVLDQERREGSRISQEILADLLHSLAPGRLTACGGRFTLFWTRTGLWTGKFPAAWIFLLRRANWMVKKRTAFVCYCWLRTCTQKPGTNPRLQ